jgi:hypothetical protein
MNRNRLKTALLVLAAGTVCLLGGGAIAHWRFSQQQWCVQLTSSGGQEATYSRGCRNPHRYRRWVFMASGLPVKPEGRSQAVAPRGSG